MKADEPHLIRPIEARVDAMDSKAIILSMSRRICIALYDAIIAIKPDWHSTIDIINSQLPHYCVELSIYYNKVLHMIFLNRNDVT